MSKIFIKNKYKRWYLSIIKNAKNRIIDDNSYSEKHHILPASIFPKYKNLKKYPWNSVLLTAKEHFVVHCLLVKITSGINRRKMLFALKMLKCNNSNQTERYTSKLFEKFRKHISKAISENNTGRRRKLPPRSEKHIKNLKISLQLSEKAKRARIENSKKAAEKTKGIPRSEHLKKQWSEKLKGRTFTEEHKKNISNSRKNKTFGPRPPYKPLMCPHCGKQGRGGIIKRWHFDNCKLKNNL